MKLYVIVIMTLVKLVASTWEEELEYKSKTMTQSEFVMYFNKYNKLWKIKQYDFIINVDFKKYDEEPKEIPVKPIDPSALRTELPKNFDARFKWRNCSGLIGKIRNQYNCLSCWAHGVANTASDRLCIHQGIRVDLSEQDLECALPNKNICHTGHPRTGFLFWKESGLVPRWCKPYEPHNLNRYGCVLRCQHNPSYEYYLANKYYPKIIYTVPDTISYIKAEIFLNGPVVASMRIYEDFNNNRGNGYHSGIYVHTHGEHIGNHSVRIIGYGVENGVEYWLVANSWGEDWGENGFFRVKIFQESKVIDQPIYAAK